MTPLNDEGDRTSSQENAEGQVGEDVNSALATPPRKQRLVIRATRVDPMRVRMVSLKIILEEIAPRFFLPVPSVYTIKRWLAAAKVQSSKTNRRARHGGGPLYYHTSHVEKVFRSRSAEV